MSRENRARHSPLKYMSTHICGGHRKYLLIKQNTPRVLSSAVLKESSQGKDKVVRYSSYKQRVRLWLWECLMPTSVRSVFSLSWFSLPLPLRCLLDQLVMQQGVFKTTFVFSVSKCILFNTHISLPVCDVWLGDRLFVSMWHCWLFSVAKSHEGKFLFGKILYLMSLWKSFGLCNIEYEFRMSEWLGYQIILMGGS